MSYLFTSESVSEGHPDKIADAISDAVLDLVMEQQNSSLRCACETLVTTNRVIVAGEYKGILHNEDVESAVRRVIKNVGYEQTGFDWRTVEITNLLHGQSADIALGTDIFGAGDQGLMFGYACNETDVHMPSAIYWSHRIVEKLTELRKNGTMICSGCNQAKGFNNKSVARAVDAIVKEREGETTFAMLVSVDMSKSVNPNWAKRWWLEEQLERLTSERQALIRRREVCNDTSGTRGIESLNPSFDIANQRNCRVDCSES